MYLYHYYDKRSGPFKSLTALSEKDAFTVLERIKRERPSSLSAQRDIDYISKRINCERIVREEAVKKGILMDILSPHYHVVEHSPWLSTWFEDPGVIKIPIEEFDTSKISFTYGDSMPTFSPLDLAGALLLRYFRARLRACSSEICCAHTPAVISTSTNSNNFLFI